MKHYATCPDTGRGLVLYPLQAVTDDSTSQLQHRLCFRLWLVC